MTQTQHDPLGWHGTTILCVRKGGQVAMAGDGQVSLGQTVVKGSDGKLYACRPFPEGAWCNVNAEAYRPGVGSAWRDAWVPY